MDLDIYSARVPSSINSIGTVVNELLHSLRNGYGDVNDCVLFELKVILNEILINAVMHGNKEDNKKFVKVDASISKDGVMFIIVEDEGNGYDFNNICGLEKIVCGNSDPIGMSESGRGIKIIEGLCDSVNVNTRGNKIVVTKNVLGI